ncbi:MAG TPA: four helix bundle protein [Phnomibacter sp.]|nr:four helix bundle protein [Phnomibacter sp.]
MFDFEKLEVYQVTKTQNIEVLKFLFEHPSLNSDFVASWKEVSMGTVLNLAESTARMTHPEKKHYLTLARGNINSCVALTELAKELGWMSKEQYDTFYNRYEQMSKMMLGMIRSFSSEQKVS